MEILTLIKDNAIKITPDTPDRQVEIANRITHLHRLMRMQDGFPYRGNYDHLREAQRLTSKLKGFTYKETQVLTENNYRWFVGVEFLLQMKFAASLYTDDRANACTDYHKLVYMGDVPDFILDRIDQLERIATENPDIFIGRWNFTILSLKPLPIEERTLKPIDPVMVGFMNSNERYVGIGHERDDPSKKLRLWLDENHKDKDASGVIIGLWNNEDEVDIL